MCAACCILLRAFNSCVEESTCTLLTANVRSAGGRNAHRMRANSKTIIVRKSSDVELSYTKI